MNWVAPALRIILPVHVLRLLELFSKLSIHRSRELTTDVPLCPGMLATNGLGGSYVLIQDRNKVFVF